uniref:Uncharacterized protein n=1 Tax=Setaria viridis TaxID=4556 RepID=A0A4U6WJH3_SETVI|nr:uncharacterized protein LOC117841655 isoform X2 [Setaria viridis]TKW42393.1 hypothetical protein SEVIR_1G381700v2 [Setaria viridis]TKW42394.1 hypothetical protein SEVIR_1G381700v2 [Setaria viridis]
MAPRVLTSRILRSASSSIRRASNVPMSKVESRPLSSYTKNKSGVWIPTSMVPKKSWFEEACSFVKKKWNGIDQRVRFLVVEFFTKSALYTVSGGGGMYLMKATLDRLEKYCSQTSSFHVTFHQSLVATGGGAGAYQADPTTLILNHRKEN